MRTRVRSVLLASMLVVSMIASAGAMSAAATVGPQAQAEEPTDSGTEGDVPADASVTFENQSVSDGTVTVDSAALPAGGFVAIHVQPGEVVGVSESLDAGTHESVEIEIAGNLSGEVDLGAVVHEDSNDNQEFDFSAQNPTVDAPITNGEPVSDMARLVLEMDEEEPDAPDNETDGETPDAPDNETDGETPDAPDNETDGETPDAPDNETDGETPDAPDNETDGETPDAPDNETDGETPDAMSDEVNVVLDGAPNGLQTYSVTVDLANESNATIEDIEAGILSDSKLQIVDQTDRSITFRAADLGDAVKSFEDARVLATLNLSERVSGDQVSVTVNELVADDGSDIDASNVSVELVSDLFTEPLPGSAAAAPPMDLNGDGLYEDVDGTGSADFDDAIALAFVDYEALSEDQQAALDFNQDGELSFGDAIEVAFQV